MAPAFAHVGGALVGAAPGAALVVYSAQPCSRCESGPVVGLSFDALGALTGMLFGGAWAAWSASHRLGGRATYWGTFGGTALGYTVPLAVSLTFVAANTSGGAGPLSPRTSPWWLRPRWRAR